MADMPTYPPMPKPSVWLFAGLKFGQLVTQALFAFIFALLLWPLILLFPGLGAWQGLVLVWAIVFVGSK